MAPRIDACPVQCINAKEEMQFRNDYLIVPSQISNTRKREHLADIVHLILYLKFYTSTRQY